jgi:hypothetical protein
MTLVLVLAIPALGALATAVLPARFDRAARIVDPLPPSMFGLSVRSRCVPSRPARVAVSTRGSRWTCPGAGPGPRFHLAWTGSRTRSSCRPAHRALPHLYTVDGPSARPAAHRTAARHRGRHPGYLPRSGPGAVLQFFSRAAPDVRGHRGLGRTRTAARRPVRVHTLFGSVLPLACSRWSARPAPGTWYGSPRAAPF